MQEFEQATYCRNRIPTILLLVLLTLNSRHMKKFICLWAFSFFLIWTSQAVWAQDTRESEIRRLENIERVSVLKGDSLALFNKIWSPNMVINTPANVVGTVEATKTLLRSGGLNYLSFERDIEKITFNGNVAIVMGGERIKPQGTQINAGKVVTRRFTHVWLYANNSWSIIARQATIIKVE
jgi:hypothetical protein